MFTLCIIQQEHLATKKLSYDFKDVATKAVKIVKSNPKLIFELQTIPIVT